MRLITVVVNGVGGQELNELLDFLEIAYGTNMQVRNDELLGSVIEITTEDHRSDAGVRVAAMHCGYKFVRGLPKLRQH